MLENLLETQTKKYSEHAGEKKDASTIQHDLGSDSRDETKNISHGFLR